MRKTILFLLCGISLLHGRINPSSVCSVTEFFGPILELGGGVRGCLNSNTTVCAVGYDQIVVVSDSTNSETTIIERDWYIPSSGNEDMKHAEVSKMTKIGTTTSEGILKSGKKVVLVK